MNSPHTLGLIQDLVRINTVSRNSNLELIHLVRDRLMKIGVKSRLTTNADKTKANLFATLGDHKAALS
jgi:acetylornithine deacetylase